MKEAFREVPKVRKKLTYLAPASLTAPGASGKGRSSDLALVKV